MSENVLAPSEVHAVGMTEDKEKCVRAIATVIVACERLVRVERCLKCKGKKGERLYLIRDRTDPGVWYPCPDCKEHPGDAYKDWQAALLSLEGGKG